MEAIEYTETTDPSDIEYYFSPTVLAEEKRQKEKLEKEKFEEKFRKPTKLEISMRNKNFKEDFHRAFVKSADVVQLE